MGKEFLDWVYASMLGDLPEERRMPEVENAFADGMPCELWYTDVIEAYQRVCDKLGVSDEPDVEAIMVSFGKITKELCYKMYEYGTRFGCKDERPCE